MRHYPILVAIETDATTFHGENPRRPALLDQGGAEQLLAHIASDLSSLATGINRCSLAMPGALYDQTQVLQPAYPVYAALESLASQAGAGGDYRPRLCSMGADGNRMPVLELQPSEKLVHGMLLILPLLLSAPVERADALFKEIEHRFMAEGQLSAHSAKGLEAGFGIPVNHARLMTLTDLNALMRMQLENFGFLSLWRLLDACLECQDDPMEVQGQQGTVFRWDGERVLCRFETFDFWARRGAGEALGDNTEARREQYGLWTREYRQYLVTLGAHGVPLAQHLPGSRDRPLEHSFLAEASDTPPRADAAQVTEHGSPELGTIAVTVSDGERLLNLYPLSPGGLDDLQAHVRETGYAVGGVSYPGTLCIAGDGRRLAQDSL